MKESILNNSEFIITALLTISTSIIVESLIKNKILKFLSAILCAVLACILIVFKTNLESELNAKKELETANIVSEEEHENFLIPILDYHLNFGLKRPDLKNLLKKEKGINMTIHKLLLEKLGFQCMELLDLHLIEINNSLEYIGQESLLIIIKPLRKKR